MFGKMGDMLKQFQTMQKLMQDEHFKAVISHPKVQALFRDPDFQAALKAQDQAKILGSPKLQALMRDPEVAPLLAKIDPNTLLGNVA